MGTVTGPQVLGVGGQRGVPVHRVRLVQAAAGGAQHARHLPQPPGGGDLLHRAEQPLLQGVPPAGPPLLQRLHPERGALQTRQEPVPHRHLQGGGDPPRAPGAAHRARPHSQVRYPLYPPYSLYSEGAPYSRGV
eukprot:3711841-Pyramimonas_sp.AAC.1